LREPWRVLWFELEGYGRTFGFGRHSSGHSGPIRLKAIILLGYVAGLVGVAAIPALRRKPAVRVLLGMFGVQFVLFTFLNGGRTMLYMVHVAALYLTFLSLCVGVLWERRSFAARALLAMVILMPLLGCGGIALRAQLDNNRRVFLPAVEFVKARLLPGQTVGATQAYGFEFGFSADKLLTDSSLGYRSGIAPHFLIVDQEKQANWDLIRAQDPAMWGHVTATLRQYRKVYDYNGITVYEKL